MKLKKTKPWPSQIAPASTMDKERDPDHPKAWKFIGPQQHASFHEVFECLRMVQCSRMNIDVTLWPDFLVPNGCIPWTASSALKKKKLAQAALEKIFRIG